MKAGSSSVGLCGQCRHARVIETPRSRFWMCSLAATDARFDKYPRLPVLNCAGFQPQEHGAADPDSSLPE